MLVLEGPPEINLSNFPPNTRPEKQTSGDQTTEQSFSKETIRKGVSACQHWGGNMAHFYFCTCCYLQGPMDTCPPNPDPIPAAPNDKIPQLTFHLIP